MISNAEIGLEIINAVNSPLLNLDIINIFVSGKNLIILLSYK